MFKVTVINPDRELSEDEICSMLPYISKERQGYVKGFKDKIKAQSVLIGEMLVRHEICKATGLKNNQFTFIAGEHGKPFVVPAKLYSDNQNAENIMNNETDVLKNICFNISHSEGCVAAVLSDEAVGIDIEVVKSREMLALKRCFTDDEKDYVWGQNRDYDPSTVEGHNLRLEEWDRFYEVWTKKESRAKWDGRGLKMPFKSFSVFDKDDPAKVAYYTVYDIDRHFFSNGRKYWGEGFFKSDAKADRVICNVCSKKQNPPEVKELSVAEFLDVFKEFKLHLGSAE